MNDVLKRAQKGAVISEHIEQAHLIGRLMRLEEKYPELALIFAVPNGAYKSRAAAAKFQREGLKSGVPDIVLPVARWPFHGLFVEMKQLGQYAKPEQRKWQSKLIAQGFASVTCQGDDAAFAVVKRYITREIWRDHPTIDAERCQHSLQKLVEGIDRVTIYPPNPAGDAVPNHPQRTAR